MPRFSEYSELTVLTGTELFAVTKVPGVVGGTVYVTSNNIRTFMQAGFVGGGGSSVAALSDLTDVLLAARASGQILRYDGAHWVNVPGLTYYDAAGAASTAQAAAATDATTKVNAHAALTTNVHGITDTAVLYRPGGTDVALADGGTGASTAALARTNLGLVIGTDVQAYNAKTAGIGSLNPAQGDVLYWNGTSWALLAAGTDGQVLVTHGGAANPTWTTSSADPTIPGRVATLENSGVLNELHGGAVTTNTAAEFTVDSFVANATRVTAIGDRIFCQWDYLIWNNTAASTWITVRIKEGVNNRLQWQVIPLPFSASSARTLSINLTITNRNNPAPGDGIDKSSWAGSMVIGGDQSGPGPTGSTVGVQAGPGDTTMGVWTGYSDAAMFTSVPQIDVRILFSTASTSIGIKRLGAVRSIYKAS